MGLDQYAHIRKQNWNLREYSFDWRKHACLQQFMMELWHDKGHEEEFNCQDMELTLDDITKLEEQVHKSYEDFPCPGGFFWGHQFQDESIKEYKEQDLDFISKAKDALKEEDSTVVYSCWY